MPTNVMAMLQSLSRAQIERLLQAKERIETLQSRRDDLRKELAQIEATLAGLLEGSGDVVKTAPGSRKAKASATTKAATKKTAKKATKKATKKAAKKTAAKKAVAQKAGAKKTVAKKAAATKPATKAAKGAKPSRGKAAAATKSQSGGGEKRATLEDVVYNLIEKRGKPVPFQDLLGTITGKKLFKTRSTNFDNVLRRTLSTSTRIKRVGRGMYGI